MLTQLVHRELAAHRITATQLEDCGTCVQMTVTAARAAGVDAAIIRALVALRPVLATHLGDEAMVELALAIAAARTYPTIKRAMGLGMSCSKVEVA